ncbi:Pumilio-family RNA binding repeat [Ceratobasidium sp. AG-Ba]|nr:Pumilio-family RNA binding repeat [Ceratobasidium sp. AG-Ba]
MPLRNRAYGTSPILDPLAGRGLRREWVATPQAQRSVPATPMSSRQSVGSLAGKPVGLGGGDVASFAQEPNGSFNMNRLSGAYDAPVTFNSIQGNEENFVSNMDGEMNGAPAFGSYEYEGGARNGAQSGSTALYQHNGSRYGLALGNGRFMSQENSNNKMGGLHGTKHKRGDIDREFNRFAGTRLEDLVGEIPALCKDQHGCRYLQKKLEEGVPEHHDIIFRETFSLFAELMTDPFRNYLCQKLLEYSTDKQRNMICESVAHDLVGISLNMHGTPAVQKMIDFLSTQRQIHSIITALSMHVVTLIKDLNGNHVVQKCLNCLIPEDNQFIYNAIAAHCVEVATHRHGCCVLQRCIDHASDSQRIQLVTEITFNALTLVQDPYGNYVVQYILDLNDNRFSDAVIRQFVGNVCALSVQKFSSNVIEKCIGVAEHNTRKMLIEELLHRNRLEKLLRDSFGNYCVQTALDYVEPTQRMLLVEGIRPILPLIQNTPYGKRIQSKLQREQMESHHQQYGSHNFNQHPGIANIAGMNGNGMGMGNRHVSQPSIHHSPLADAYNRPNLYTMPQQMHPGVQQQLMEHYSTPHMMPSNLHHSPMTATSVFPNVSGFSSPTPNNYGALGILAGMSDPHRPASLPVRDVPSGRFASSLSLAFLHHLNSSSRANRVITTNSVTSVYF